MPEGEDNYSNWGYGFPQGQDNQELLTTVRPCFKNQLKDRLSRHPV